MKLKELLTIAKNELSELSTLENPDFRLEQAVFKRDEGVWEVVVSYLVENTNKPVRTEGMFKLAPEFPFLRIYKKLTLNDKNELLSMVMFDPKE